MGTPHEPGNGCKKGQHFMALPRGPPHEPGNGYKKGQHSMARSSCSRVLGQEGGGGEKGQGGKGVRVGL